MEFDGHQLEWLTLGVLVLTIVAIVYGPIKAVQITRKRDEEREDRNRKLAVFRTLMQTRRSRTNQDHVGALNLIELEFYEVEPVRTAYRAYIRHLGSPLPATDQQPRYFEERDDLYADLLQTMGTALSYVFDKRELMRQAYIPVLWEDDFMLHGAEQPFCSRKHWRELGRCQLLDFKHGNKARFPPPPETQN